MSNKVKEIREFLQKCEKAGSRINWTMAIRVYHEMISTDKPVLSDNLTFKDVFIARMRNFGGIV